MKREVHLCSRLARILGEELVDITLISLIVPSHPCEEHPFLLFLF